MLVVELGNVAAVRRREVCIDIVEGVSLESSSSSSILEKVQPCQVYRVGAMRSSREYTNSDAEKSSRVT